MKIPIFLFNFSWKSSADFPDTSDIYSLLAGEQRARLTYQTSEGQRKTKETLIGLKLMILEYLKSRLLSGNNWLC